MSGKWWGWVIVGGLCLLAWQWTLPSLAAQEPTTPTPDAAGNIYVIVQANDSLWAIASRAGLTLPELLALNDLTEDAVIVPGQRLLIGRGAPQPTPTEPGPPPTPTHTRPPPPPTETAVPPPRTAICLKAFTDLNRNGGHDPGEPFRASVALTIFNDQQVVGNYVTDGVSEPYCLEALPPGDYKITRSLTPDEVLTTAGDWTLTLVEGNVIELAFGSYMSTGKGTPPAVTANAPVSVGETAATTPDSVTVPSTNTPTGGVLVGLGFILSIIASAGAYILLRRKQKLS